MIAIFIPRHASNDPKVLKDLGVDTLFDESNPAVFADCLQGPDGQIGKLIYSNGLLAINSVNTERQRWEEFDGYWLGFWKDHQPTPEMLQRTTVFDGPEVRLCDANHWVIPIADYLPKRLGRDRISKAEIELPSLEHAGFVEWANRLFAEFISTEFQNRVKEEKVVRYEGGFTFAALALAKNYRMNCDLADMLGIIDQMTAFTIARVATGLALVESAAAQKKTSELVATN